MNNLKSGDKVAIKATGQEAVIGYASTILEKNFYLLTIDGSAIRNRFGEIKEFYIEDLDYTNDQKEWFQHEADQHEYEVRGMENEYHFFNR